MSDTTSFVLVYPDAAYPSSRTLAVGTGLAIDISGSAVTINPGERLSSLASMNNNGIVCYTASSKTYTPRSFVNGNGIIVSQQEGQGNITIAQDPGTVIQKVQVTDVDAEEFATSSTVQFVASTSDLSVTTASDPDTGYAVVTIGSTNPTGTVTSVNCTSSNAFITVSGVPITSSGTIALTINTLSIAKGGTGQTTRSAAFNALSPITTAGDTIIGTGTDTATRLPISGNSRVLGVVSGLPAWVGGAPSSGDVLTYNGTIIDWAAPAPLTATYVCQTGTNLPTNGINLDDPEGILVVGSTNSASLPPDIYTENGVGTLTVFNEWGSDDLQAGNMFVACADISGFVATKAPAMSLYGYRGSNDIYTPSIAINTYSSDGDSASGGTAILDGSAMLEIAGYGKYDTGAGNFAKAAAITFDTNDDFTSATSHPTIIRFKTSNYGDAEAVSRMQINSNGTVTVFGTLEAGTLNLDTPLALTQGGTGLSAVGAASTYLKSNGTVAAWSLPYVSGGGAATCGRSNGITATTAVTINTTAVTANSVITLTLTNLVGTITTAYPCPTFVNGSIVAGTSFQIQVFNVGGVGQATSVDVMWSIAVAA